MIRINLLPPEIQGVSEHKLNPSYVLVGVAGFWVVVLLPISGVQISQRKRVKDDVAQVQSDLEHYKPIVAQVEQLEQAKAQLVQRKSIIQQLESERLRYPYFMEDFLKLLPNNVWLTNLVTTIPPDGGSITVGMDVTALDHYAVADMVSNLETSQIFSDVEVGPIALTQTATSQSISFHLSSIYRKAATAVPNNNAPKKS